MRSGVGLGSTVPPPCSSLSSLSLGASFPTLSSSLPLVLAPPGFSASFAAPPPLASLPPSFPGSSPSVASFHPSFLAPAPPGFHLTLPVRPLAPSMGLRPHSLFFFAPSQAPSSFSVASLLSPAPGSSTLLLPSSVPAPPPFPRAPFPPSPYFPFVSAPSAAAAFWSLPMVPACSAPFLSSLTSSLAPLVLSLGPTAPPPLVLSLYRLLPIPLLCLLLYPLSTLLALLVLLPLLLALMRILALAPHVVRLPPPRLAPVLVWLVLLVPRILTACFCTMILVTPW